MIDVHELLQRDAAQWQRDVDDGHRELAVDAASGSRPARQTALAMVGSAAVVAAVVAGSLLIHERNDHPQTTGERAASTLQGVTWVDPTSKTKVVFNAHTVRIDDGCSNGLSELTTTARTLVVGGPIGTQSACGGVAAPPGGPALRAYERQQAAIEKVSRVLHGPASWTRHGDTLRLVSPAGELVLRTNDRRVPQVAGTTWRLQRASTINGELPKLLGHPFLTVSPDGALRADDLCGRGLTASAAVTDLTLTITNVTRAAGPPCPPSVSRQAASVVTATLTGTIEYSLRDQQLILYGADSTVLNYTADR